MDILPRKRYIYLINIWKDALYNYSPKKCKLKQQQVIFSHPLEQLKSRQTMTSVGEDGEKWEPYTLLMGT